MRRLIGAPSVGVPWSYLCQTCLAPTRSWQLGPLTGTSRHAGLSICLVSRTEAKLNEAAAAIAAMYKVDTKIFVADLVAAGRTDPKGVWPALATLVATLDVGVLVNNAGMSYDHYEYLENVDAETVDSIVAINAVSLTKARFCTACC